MQSLSRAPGVVVGLSTVTIQLAESAAAVSGPSRPKTLDLRDCGTDHCDVLVNRKQRIEQIRDRRRYAC